MAKPKRKALSLVTLEGIMTLGAAVVLSHQKMHRERPGYWPVRKFQFNLLEELRSMHFVTYSAYADRIPLDDYPPDNDPRWQERQKLAATVSIQSFEFSWDHLYRFPILGPFLPAKLPWKKDLYDGLQPIADMDADTRAINALSELFEYLAHQIFMGADLDPAPCGDKEEWFALSMSPLTLDAPVPRPRGRPKGSGYIEQDAPVIQRALALYHSGLSAAKAAREAIKDAQGLPGSSPSQTERRIRDGVYERLKSAAH